MSKQAWVNSKRRLNKECDAQESKILSSLKSHELVQEMNDLNKSRHDAHESTFKRMTALRHLFHNLKSQLHQDHLHYAQKNVPALLETFESKLTAFKLSMRTDYDFLEQAEKSVIQELITVSENVETWELDTFDQITGANSSPRARSGARRRSAFDLSIAAEEEERENREKYEQRQNDDLDRRAIIGSIDRKIAVLGQDGGWDSRDHAAFIKVWAQVVRNAVGGKGELVGSSRKPATLLGEGLHKNDEVETLVLPEDQRRVLVRKLCIVPMKTTEELEEHIDWYLKFLYLTQFKRALIVEWKKEIVSQRVRAHQEVLKSEVLDENESVHDINLHHPNDHRRASVAGGGAGGPGFASSVRGFTPVDEGRAEEERLAAREKVAKWRAEKDKRLTEEKQERQRAEEERKQQQAEEVQRRQSTLKKQINEWKEEEEMQQQAKADSQQQQPASAADPEVLKRMQARDAELALARQQKLEQAANKKNERENRIKELHSTLAQDPENSKIPVSVERDFNRLLAPTKASSSSALSYEDLDYAEQRRAGTSAHDSAIAMSGRDLKFAGRATPAWRKPVT